jgi:YVTN family beta-propeller protein
MSFRSRSSRLLACAVAAAALTASAVSASGSAARRGAASPVPDIQTRNVLLVGNNWDGTVDVIDERTFQRLDQINTAPDLQERLAEQPDQAAAAQLNNEFAAEGHYQLVDDMRISPDGRTMYVSRPSLGDVAAFDFVTHKELWHLHASGYRTDHMALTPDGRFLLVSATISNVVDVIDTEKHAIVKSTPTGDFPHENEFSEDGSVMYNGSIGRVIAPDDPALDAAKGNRWFEIIDGKTFDVIKVIDFGRGVRPFHVMPDGRTMYVQLSFFNGFYEYDLQDEKFLRTVELPYSEEAKNMPRSEYPLDSAHHGLALSGDESKICDAGTIDDYVAILTRATLSVDRIIPVGDIPYWATTSSDGKNCFVANSGTDDVSVISFAEAKELARIPVGDHPQRMRTAKIKISPRLKVKVRPRRANAGELTRFRVKVRGGVPGDLFPASGAKVKLGRKSRLTNERGRASFKLRLRRPGRHRVVARVAGGATARANVRVLPPG